MMIYCCALGGVAIWFVGFLMGIRLEEYYSVNQGASEWRVHPKTGKRYLHYKGRSDWQ